MHSSAAIRVDGLEANPLTQKGRAIGLPRARDRAGVAAIFIECRPVVRELVPRESIVVPGVVPVRDSCVIPTLIDPRIEEFVANAAC